MIDAAAHICRLAAHKVAPLPIVKAESTDDSSTVLAVDVVTISILVGS